MQRKIHHQRDYDKGDARIKSAVVNAWVIWNIPTPISMTRPVEKMGDMEFIHCGFVPLNIPIEHFNVPLYGFNCNGDIVKKY